MIVVAYTAGYRTGGPQLRRAALCGPVLLHIVDAYEAYAALGDG